MSSRAVKTEAVVLRSMRYGEADRILQLYSGSLEELRATIPAGRVGEPDEFGATCAFLCSRQAAYITGQTVGIDGGALRGVH